MEHDITSVEIGGSFEEYLQQQLSELDPEDRKLFEKFSAQDSLAVELIKLLKSRGLTQVQLAKRSGVNQSEISRIERGTANPSLETLNVIGRVFAVRIGFVAET